MLPAFLLGNLALIAGLFALLWVVSLVIRDASIVDPCWGLAFVAIAWATFIRHPSPAPGVVDPSPLIVAMVTIWGLRLSGTWLGATWARARTTGTSGCATGSDRASPC